MLALALVPAAEAGGDWLPVAATAGRVWVANGNGVIELDAPNGRILRVAGTRYPFTTDLALSGGAVWAASIGNGYTAGAVTRIPFDASHGATALVLPHRPLYELVSDGRAAWALTGPHSHQCLTRIDATTGAVHFVPVPATVGFLAADPSGAVPGLFALTSRDVVLRYDAAGHASRLARVAGEGTAAPAVGLGSVWLTGRSSLVRLDPDTGRVEGRLRVDPERMRVTARSALPGMTGDRLAAGNGFLWLTDSAHRLWRIDLATLRQIVFARLP